MQSLLFYSFQKGELEFLLETEPCKLFRELNTRLILMKLNGEDKKLISDYIKKHRDISKEIIVQENLLEICKEFSNEINIDLQFLSFVVNRRRKEIFQNFYKPNLNIEVPQEWLSDIRKNIITSLNLSIQFNKFDDFVSNMSEITLTNDEVLGLIKLAIKYVSNDILETILTTFKLDKSLLQELIESVNNYKILEVFAKFDVKKKPKNTTIDTFYNPKDPYSYYTRDYGSHNLRKSKKLSDFSFDDNRTSHFYDSSDYSIFQSEGPKNYSTVPSEQSKQSIGVPLESFNYSSLREEDLSKLFRCFKNLHQNYNSSLLHNKYLDKKKNDILNQLYIKSVEQDNEKILSKVSYFNCNKETYFKCIEKTIVQNKYHLFHILHGCEHVKYFKEEIIKLIDLFDRDKMRRLFLDENKMEIEELDENFDEGFDDDFYYIA